jgi:hypothetical protein
MRRLKLVVARQFIVLILSCCCLSSHGTSKVLIKANVLRGERFVTDKTNARKIEDKVSEVFVKKGFEVLTNVEPTGDILLVDLFIYQFPGQYPAMSITIRTRQGVHYFDQDYRKFFANRDLTNLNLAIDLAERVPVELSRDVVYRIGIGDLLSANKTVGTVFTLCLQLYGTKKAVGTGTDCDKIKNQ